MVLTKGPPDSLACEQMQELTWRQAAFWRVRRQHLDRRAPARGMLEVASRLCGLHAQVMSSAELTLWARIENLDRQAVQRALWQDRSLVKTWAMRGTLHLLPARELSMWHAALSTSRRYLNEAPWKKYFGLTLNELNQLTEAIGTALQGRIVTREELVQEVARLTGSAAFGKNIAASSWGTILKPAAFTGRLCFAPSIGQRVRFTNPKTWLASNGAQIDPEAALKDITRRFLHAYGPASERDLGRWSGSGVSAVRRRFASLRDEITPVDVQGTRAWMLSADARKIQKLDLTDSVRLLPAFDQYVIGASYHAEHLMPEGFRPRVYRQQGWVSPVLLVNGFMHGTWSHIVQRARTGSRVEVVIEPFVKLPAWVRKTATQEAERLAVFLGAELSRVKFAAKLDQR